MLDIDRSEVWPYVEALPRFNILTLDKEWRRGARVICWYDQDEVMVGDAGIILDDTGVDLAYAFGETDGYVDTASGVCRFDVVRRDDGRRGERPAVVCPHCGQRKEILLFLDWHWQCRMCHDVKSLTNRLDAATRQYLRLQAYGEYVKGMRPKGVHHTTHAKHVAEYKRLKKAWGRRPPRTFQHVHRFRVSEQYSKAGEIQPPKGFDTSDVDGVRLPHE